MKLLFDQNLSPKLVERLETLFPGSEHVDELGLGQASDEIVWSYARQHDLAIVSKDADFSEFSVLRGFPPKVIWIRLGNCTTAEIEAVLQKHHAALLAFKVDSSVGILELM
jgi:predicted nuclease of predicted toxin-antitoxin system